jgi:hypothetical protein
MAPRSELQTLLVELLGSGNVYFQPPTNLVMSYPCIIYNRDSIDIRHADNKPYKHEKRYQITVVDADSDSDIPDKVEKLPRCSFDRAFVADNLNHTAFNLYF